MSEVLVITSGKGGVGKTTTCANIGTGLAKMGYKVIKKNYLTIEGRKMEGKKAWKSPLTGKIYDIPAKTRILVRVGDGFKRYIENKKMPDKLCRFVDSAANVPVAVNQ